MDHESFAATCGEGSVACSILGHWAECVVDSEVTDKAVYCYERKR